MKNLLLLLSLFFLLSLSCKKSNLLDREALTGEEISADDFESMLNNEISALNVNEIILFYKEDGKYRHETASGNAAELAVMSREKPCCRAAGNDAFAAHVKDMLDKGRCVEIALNRWGSAVAAERDCH